MFCSKQGNATKGYRFNNVPAPDANLWEAANEHVPHIQNGGTFGQMTNSHLTFCHSQTLDIWPSEICWDGIGFL